MNPDAPICTYYLRNACNFGSACTFSHQRPVVGQKSSQPTHCKYFLQGNCAYGDKCTRSHDVKAQSSKATKGKKANSESDSHTATDPEPKSQNSDVPADREDDGGWGSHWPSQDPPGETSGSSKGEQATESDKSPCIFWTLQGSCDNGDHCTFSHSGPSGSGKKGTNDNAGNKKDKKGVTEYWPTQRDAKSTKNSTQSSSTLKAYQQTSGPPSPAFSLKRGQSSGSDDDGISHGQSHAGLEDDEEMEYQERQDNASKRDDHESESGLQQDESDANGEALWGDEVDQPQDDAPTQQQTSRLDRKSKGSRSYGEDVRGARESSASPSPHHNHSRRTEKTSNPPKMKYPHASEVQIHWSQFADPLASPETPFCKLHAQGQCMQGEECRFRHSVTVEEHTLLFRDQQPNLWTLKRDTDATTQPARPARRPIPEQPASSQEEIQSVPQKPHSTRPAVPPIARECMFYSLGKCRNGDKCPYRHERPPEAPDTAPLNSDQDSWGSGGNSRFDRGKSNRPCRFFAARGYCHMGDSCKFSHGDANPNRNYPSSGASGPQSSSPKENEDDNGWGTPWEPNDNTGANAEPAAAVDDWGGPTDYSGWGSTTEPAPKDDLKTSDGDQWPPADDSSPHAPWVVPSSTVSCPYFAKGRCRKGDACNMRHDAQEQGSHSSRPENTSSNPVAAPKEAEHADVADDADKSWSQPWPTEGESSYSKPTKFDVPCKDYGEGHCRFGDDCRYMHVIVPESSVQEEEEEEERQLPPSNPVDEIEPLPNDSVEEVEEPISSNTVVPPMSGIEEVPGQEMGLVPEPDLEPIVFDHPHVQKLVMNCEVTFGNDITPSKVKPLSDATDLLLSELPLHVGPGDIQELAGPYGEIEEITSVDDTGPSLTVLVKFAEINQAINAFKHLNGRTFQSSVIVASLKAQVPYTLRFPGQNLVLKITWPKPRVFAWSHYQTVSKAKAEASRLNDVIFQGRKIKAEFITPPRNQRDSYSVIKLDRLPLDVTKAEIEGLCQDTTLVTVNRPTYSGDPVEAIHSSLSTFGGLQFFDILPESDTLPTSTAFATFKTEQMAEAARESLDNSNPEFLGKEALTVRPAHFSRYRIVLEQFEALKNELDRLIEKCGKKCTIQYNDHRLNKNVKFVHIYAPFEHGQAFADLNAELWQLLHGIILKSSDGSEVWDNYFDIPSSDKILKQCSIDANALIFCDRRMKQLRLFGSESDQQQAHKMIMRLLSKVHSQRHEIELPRPKLHPLLNGTLTALQLDIGINKVSLDVLESKLVVRGNGEDVSRAELAVESLSPDTENLGNFEACQICKHAPVKPITLSCHHKYCHYCLEFAIRQIGYAPFKCVSRQQDKQCPAYIPYVILSGILAAKEEEEVLRSSFTAHVRSKQDGLFFCPSLNCKAVYRSGEEGINITCKFCLTELCTYCRSFAHARLSCAERNMSQEVNFFVNTC